MSAENGDYTTVEEMGEFFSQKISVIRESLKFRHFDDETALVIGNLEESITGLESLFGNIDTEIKAGLEKVSEIQKLHEKVGNINKRLDHIDKNFPSILLRPTSAPSVHKGTRSCVKENIAPVQRNSRDAPKVQYVTVQEFEAVPKYMKGRVKYEQLNKFVDDLNSTIEKKYKVLRLPRKDMKIQVLRAVQKLKSQESVDTKGLYFCTAEDISEYSNIKVDRCITQFLIMLRHCSKIKEIRGPGPILRYAVVV